MASVLPSPIFPMFNPKKHNTFVAMVEAQMHGTPEQEKAAIRKYENCMTALEHLEAAVEIAREENPLLVGRILNAISYATEPERPMPEEDRRANEKGYEDYQRACAENWASAH